MSSMPSRFALAITCLRHGEGQFRTRQGTVAGFPELIGKELESWTQQQYERIVARRRLMAAARSQHC